MLRKRILSLAMGALLVGGLTAATMPSAAAAPTVIVDSLTVTANAQAGQSVSASARVRTSSGTLKVQAITIAVRSGGKAFDFPGARQNVNLTTRAATFTPAPRTFTAGTYDAFVAVMVNNRWTNLTPAKRFTVVAPAPSKVTVDSLSIPTIEAGKPVAAAVKVRSSGAPVAAQAVTVAVRKGTQAVDFPGAKRDVTIPSGGYTFTTATRTFDPGSYQAFVAVLVDNKWTNLAPAKNFTVTAAPAPPTTPAPPPNNPLTYANEFSVDGKDWNAGTSVGSGRLYTDPCWKNPKGCNDNTTQVEYNDNHAEVKNGALVITADRKTTGSNPCGDRACTSASARLTMIDWQSSKGPYQTFGQAGGHFEAKIKMPVGPGMWPAFWTVGDPKAGEWPTNGEIDIAEYFGGSNTLATYLHYGRDSNSDVNWGASVPGVNVADWHVYSLDWDNSDNGELRFSVDGNPVRTVKAADAKAKDPGLWQRIQTHPQSVIVNLAVGGAGGAAPAGEFSKKMEVDYIRIYEKPFPKQSS